MDKPMTLEELKKLATKLQIPGRSKMDKAQLLRAVADAAKELEPAFWDDCPACDAGLPITKRVQVQTTDGKILDLPAEALPDEDLGPDPDQQPVEEETYDLREQPTFLTAKEMAKRAGSNARTNKRAASGNKKDRRRKGNKVARKARRKNR